MSESGSGAPSSGTGTAAALPQRARWRHLLTTFAAEVFVTAVAAFVTTRLLNLHHVSTIPILVGFIAVALTYLAVVALTQLLPDDMSIKRRWRPHLTLLLLFIAMVTTPMVVMQSLNNARANELLAHIQQLEETQKAAEKAQAAEDTNRLHLYGNVTRSLQRVLPRESIGTNDFKDLLNDCLTSVYTTNPIAAKTGDIRAAVFYASGHYLVMPPHGYEGRGLHRGIEGLRFDISDKTAQESKQAFCERVGVAGSCYRSAADVTSPDVQVAMQGFCYKPVQESENERADRAMICVPIPDLHDPDGQRAIGVLAISSLTPRVFTDNDKAIAHFFAALFGKYSPPVEGLIAK